NALIKQAYQKQLVVSLDIQLARLLVPENSPQYKMIFILILWLSLQTRSGHVCVKPDKLTPETLFQGKEQSLAAEILALVESSLFAQWQTILVNHNLASDGGQTPLIIDGQRLYFQRLWCAER